MHDFNRVRQGLSSSPPVPFKMLTTLKTLHSSSAHTCSFYFAYFPENGFSKSSDDFSSSICSCSACYSPVGMYLLKVNKRNTRKRCKICSKLTIKTTERRSGVCIVKLWTYITPSCSSVSIVNFEYVIAGWVSCFSRAGVHQENAVEAVNSRRCCRRTKLVYY